MMPVRSVLDARTTMGIARLAGLSGVALTFAGLGGFLYLVSAGLTGAAVLERFPRREAG